MILFGYLLRNILKRLFVAIPVLVLIYMVFDLSDQGRILAAKVGWSSVMRISLLHIPLVVVQIIPVALLISIVLACSNLQQGGELDALACLGFSPKRGYGPIIVAGLMCAFIALLLDELVVPPCEQAADREAGSARVSALTGLRPPSAWVRFGNWFYHLSRRGARRLLAIQINDRFQALQRVEGWISPQHGRIHQAVVRDLRPQANGLAGRKVDTLQLPGLDKLELLWRKQSQRAESLSSIALGRWLDRLEAVGQIRTAEVLVLHTKIAFPLLNIVMAIFACSFIVGFRPRAPVKDLARAVLLSLALWIILALGWAMGRGGWIPPGVAVWAPLGIGALWGAFGLFKNTRE